MKTRITTLLFLLFCSYAGIYAQTLTKAEIKAQKQEQKAKQKEEQEKELAKKGATALRVMTTFATQKDALDYIVSSLISRGNPPAYIDKDYYIVKTGQKVVRSLSYSSTYTIIKQGDKIVIQAQSIGKQELVIGAAIKSVPDFPVRYGYRGDVFVVAWEEMQDILFANLLPHSNIDYIKILSVN